MGWKGPVPLCRQATAIYSEAASHWGSEGQTLLKTTPRSLASHQNVDIQLLKLHTTGDYTAKQKYSCVRWSVQQLAVQQYSDSISNSIHPVATVHQDDWYLTAMLQPSRSHGHLIYHHASDLCCMYPIAKHTMLNIRERTHGLWSGWFPRPRKRWNAVALVVYG